MVQGLEQDRTRVSRDHAVVESGLDFLHHRAEFWLHQVRKDPLLTAKFHDMLGNHQENQILPSLY
jgi:hypothetical protein